MGFFFFVMRSSIYLLHRSHWHITWAVFAPLQHDLLNLFMDFKKHSPIHFHSLHFTSQARLTPITSPIITSSPQNHDPITHSIISFILACLPPLYVQEITSQFLIKIYIHYSIGLTSNFHSLTISLYPIIHVSFFCFLLKCTSQNFNLGAAHHPDKLNKNVVMFFFIILKILDLRNLLASLTSHIIFVVFFCDF